MLALLVVGQGLFHTDALEKPTTLIARLGGRTGMGAIVLVLAAAMVASAVVNDTPVVVMFLPIITAIAAGRGVADLQDADAAVLRRAARRHDDADRHLDQPARRRCRREGRRPHDRLLRFHRSGGAMALAGFAYVAFVLPKILKARTGMAAEITGGSGKQFIAQIDIG